MYHASSLKQVFAYLGGCSGAVLDGDEGSTELHRVQIQFFKLRVGREGSMFPRWPPGT